jgi:hypothetical protein
VTACQAPTPCTSRAEPGTSPDLPSAVGSQEASGLDVELLINAFEYPENYYSYNVALTSTIRDATRGEPMARANGFGVLRSEEKLLARDVVALAEACVFLQMRTWHRCRDRVLVRIRRNAGDTLPHDRLLPYAALTSPRQPTTLRSRAAPSIGSIAFCGGLYFKPWYLPTSAG